MIGGERSPGIEVNGGSFGQAVSQTVGVAWARRKQGDTGRVFVFLRDGELQEGQSWEAIMSIGVLKLDNMTVVVSDSFENSAFYRLSISQYLVKSRSARIE